MKSKEGMRRAASKKFEEGRPPASLFPNGARQIAADGRPYAFYNSGDYEQLHRRPPRVTLPCNPGSPDAAYAQYLIAALALRSDSGPSPAIRAGPKKAIARAGRG